MHSQRLIKRGAPGYVDQVSGQTVTVTLFQESLETAAKLQKGSAVAIAPAGVDRAASAPAVDGTVSSIKKAGKTAELQITLSGAAEGFKPTGLMRLWAK